MFGIENPVIRERTWRNPKPISEATFKADMGYAEQLHAKIYTWTGEDREGKPLAVVWIAGPNVGQLFSAYEFTPGGE